MDPLANFPYSFVDVPPSPADSGTTLKLRGGGASVMPRGGDFNMPIWKAGVIATKPVSEIVRVATITETTVAVGSNAAVLPQDTIHLTDASEFSGDGGTAGIELTDGTTTFVKYEGTTGTTLTGCTGGVGTLHTGDRVTDDWINITREQESTKAINIIKGMQCLAAITKKWFDDLSNSSLSTFTNFIETAFGAGTITTLDHNIFKSVEGFSSCLAAPPTLLAALDFIPFPNMLVNDLPNIADDYDLSATLIVVNLANTQMIWLIASASVDELDPDGSIDWTTASVFDSIGADLSYDPDNGVQSTLGGLFLVYAIFAGSRD